MWLWLIGAVLFFAIGMFALGYADVHDDEKIILFWGGFFAVLFWPLVLAAVTVFGPFVGFFWLGTRYRDKRNAKSDK